MKVALAILFNWNEVHISIHENVYKAEMYLDLFDKSEVKNYKIVELFEDENEE